MRLAAAILTAVVPFVAAQDPGFTNPPVGINQNDYDFDPVWYVGETQIVSWTTPFSNYSITLWQESLPGGSATPGSTIYAIEPGAENVLSFPWTVTTGAFDLRVSPVFFLWLTPGQTAGVAGNDALSSTSRYFNISAKAPAASSTSTSLSSSSTQSLSLSTSSSQPRSTTTTVPARNTTSSPIPSSQPSTLSTGAKTGIAFGIVIIFAIAIGLAIFFALSRRKKVKRTSLPPQYIQEPPQRYAWEPPQKAHEHAELHAQPSHAAPLAFELG